MRSLKSWRARVRRKSNKYFLNLESSRGKRSVTRKIFTVVAHALIRRFIGNNCYFYFEFAY